MQYVLVLQRLTLLYQVNARKTGTERAQAEKQHSSDGENDQDSKPCYLNTEVLKQWC